MKAVEILFFGYYWQECSFFRSAKIQLFKISLGEKIFCQGEILFCQRQIAITIRKISNTISLSSDRIRLSADKIRPFSSKVWDFRLKMGKRTDGLLQKNEHYTSFSSWKAPKFSQNLIYPNFSASIPQHVSVNYFLYYSKFRSWK